MSDSALRRTPEAWSLLAGALDPMVPPGEARARLMSDLGGPRKYLPFALDLSEHFDLPLPRMSELLARIDHADGWTPGVAPILGFLHFRPGASLLPAHGGFVRMQAGSGFPPHRHRDRELTFVLEGHLIDDRGNRYAAGQSLDMPQGSSHTLRVIDGEDALIALLHGKIEMLGQ